MDTLSLHYQRLVGLNWDCVIASVDVDVKNRTLTLALEFSGTRVARRSLKALFQYFWQEIDAVGRRAISIGALPWDTQQT